MSHAIYTRKEQGYTEACEIIASAVGYTLGKQTTAKQDARRSLESLRKLLHRVAGRDHAITDEQAAWFKDRVGWISYRL